MENSTMEMTQKKKTLGKQKIEMKKIEKLNYRYTTFTKRRAGLFKKAAELCLQTGADMVALVTSPGNHTFAFSSQPNPEDLLHHVIPGNRYVGPTPTSSSLLVHDRMMNGENVRELKLNERYRKLTAATEAEVGGRRTFWWSEEIEVERMGKEELECYVKALEEVKSNVEKILMEKSSNGVEKMLMEKGYVCFS